MNSIQKLGLIALLAGLVGCAGNNIPSVSVPSDQAALAVRFTAGASTQALREDIASASIKVTANNQVKTFAIALDASWFASSKDKVVDLSGLPSGDASVSVKVYDQTNRVIGQSTPRRYLAGAMVNLVDGESDVPIRLENGRRSLLRIPILLSGEGHTNLRPLTPVGSDWVDYSFMSSLKTANGDFAYITGMAQDATGDFYIVDGINAGIYKVTQDGSSSFKPIANLGLTSDIACDGTGSLYVADNLNFRGSLKKISDATASTIATLSTEIRHISCTASGDIAVLSYNDAYRLINNKWSSAINIGSGMINGIVEDNQGNLFVLANGGADGNVIYKIAKDNTKTIFAGGPEGDQDGTGTSARFLFLKSISIDANNNLYVGDELKIRKITPDAVVTTLQTLNSEMFGKLTFFKGDIFHTYINYEANGFAYVINRLHLE